MFSDYKKRVIAFYNKQNKHGKLASNMSHPTPAKLREECLMVYSESTKPSDENTLRTFFGSRGVRPDYSRAIQQVNTDKFRPLINFLKGDTADTDSKNIELLAWLINFEPRPYQFSNEPEPDQPHVMHPSVKTETVKQSNIKPNGGGIYKYLLALTVLCTGGAYLYSTNQPNCMYWEGSQYQPINCEEKIPGVMLLPFDSHKIKHFKRITRPDTLDDHHVGSTWYTKAGMDSVDFYTDAGIHPTSQKALRPVTKYIIRKYVKDRRSIDRDEWPVP